MEISYVGATDGSLSPTSFNQSNDLTGLIPETTFTNRSLFAYLYSLVSEIIYGTLTFDDFVTSTESFHQYNSCVSRAPVMILIYFPLRIPCQRYSPHQQE